MLVEHCPQPFGQEALNVTRGARMRRDEFLRMALESQSVNGRQHAVLKSGGQHETSPLAPRVHREYPVWCLVHGRFL